MVQFLSINFFSWISSIFVGFFKSSHFFVSPCTSNKMQRYAVYLFLETALHVSGSTPHPSSGAHITVSTASGTCQTVTATCRYREGVETCPKHVKRFPEINKLCNVASCWIYIYIRITVVSSQTQRSCKISWHCKIQFAPSY